MKIYLVRHGQSEGNVRSLCYGSTDLPLTPLGREQARLVGKKLKDVPLAHCYVSPLSRARDTAALVLEGREVPTTPVPGLREQHMGRFESLSVEQIRAEDPDFFQRLMSDWTHTCPPEGEPFDTALAPRVAAALDAIVEAGEDCLIVAHFGPLSYAVAYLLGLPMESCHRFFPEQGCYTLIEVDKERIYNASHALLRHYNV